MTMTPTSAAAAEDFRLVFTYCCTGAVPTQDGDASEVAQYLAAAEKLKGLRVPVGPDDNNEEEEELGPAAAAREDAPPARNYGALRAPNLGDFLIAAAARKGIELREVIDVGEVIEPREVIEMRTVTSGSDDAVSRKRKLEVPVPSQTAGPGVAEAGCTNEDVLAETCALVRRFRFGHEHIGDSRMLRCPELWSVMLDVGMPLTALIRNLGRITSLGLLRDEARARKVAACLTSEPAVRGARLHPITLLEALRVYESGRGDKGGLTWSPCAEVACALEAAFYLAFKNVEPTGLRYLLGLDVSSSMDATKVCGMPALSARDAAAAVLMALLRSETHVTPMAFSSGFVPLRVGADQSLAQVRAAMSSLPFQGTDCSLPMRHALQHRIPVDVFVVLTDNETNSARRKHPAAALREYRQAMGLPDAKLVVLAFSATEFSIADPQDPSMMDVAGLDSAVPRILREFALGRL